MKKHIVSLLLVTCLGTVSWAQGSRELFDVRKSQEELEIMKGILGTTLSFVAQNLQQPATSAQAPPAKTSGSGTGISSGSGLALALGSSSFWRYSNINAFYLYGQGAVFVIPTSSLRLSNVYSAISGDVYRSLEAATGQIDAYAKAMSDYARAESSAAAQAGSATAPKAAQAPKPPVPPQVADREELRKRIEAELAQTRKSREDLAVRQQRLEKTLEEAKSYLIEALANYGDSMTTVKPNEYISLVIATDDFDVFAPPQNEVRTRRQIISVQKSWITDYKAGRLTLDAFKQKVLQYGE